MRKHTCIYATEQQKGKFLGFPLSKKAPDNKLICRICGKEKRRGSIESTKFVYK